jgi:uncharacterized protein (TIGR02246 family)
MTAPPVRIGPAATPEDLHSILEQAFRSGDLDAFVAAHEPDATSVVPPEGRVVHGRDAIRSATAPLIALRPHLTSTVLKVVPGDGVALTHARWEMAGVQPDGTPFELGGRGTIVSRRRDDGTWAIVLDDPLTPDTLGTTS